MHLIFLFSLILLNNVATETEKWEGWVLQNSGTTSHLNAVHFINSSTGWVAGENGTILKTIDEGITWTTQTSNVSENLNSIFFIDENSGWVAGNSGTILSTTNGGATWTEQSSGTSVNLLSIHFINSSTGWVVGDNTELNVTILNTTNGGTTWTAQSSELSTPLNSVYFIDSNLGWAVGPFGMVFATNNGGTTWTRKMEGAFSGKGLNSVHFIDANNGWIVGSSILHTNDGGINWIEQTSEATSYRSVHFIDENFGWVVGGANLKTIDGGINWTTQTGANSLRSVYFADENSGWAVGSGGRIFKADSLSLNLQAPNGGEIWQAGTQKSITWISENISDIGLQYSTNNGSSWTHINSYLPAESGSYPWTIPNSPTTNARVRISNFLDPANADTSDLSFSIVSLNLTNPVTSVNWAAGSIQNIAWTSGGISNVSIDYSINNGETWTTIVDNFPADSSSYEWLVPQSSSLQALIRIRDAQNPDIFSQSPLFNIYILKLTSPIGEENWQAGTQKNITWTSENISNVRLQYSINDGLSWISINNFANAESGSYIWTIPNNPTTQARVRINNTSITAQADTSDEVFSIYAYSLNLTKPNTNVTWAAGSTQEITWSSEGISNVKLEYTTDNGTIWNTIEDSVAASSGLYSWIVPNIPTTEALIRISDVDSLSFFKISSTNFKISSLSLTAPNGGERWQTGTQKSITWTSENISTVRLQYSTDDGLIWNNIHSSLPAASGNYVWTVPNTPNNQTKVRINNASLNTQADTSNGVFSIVSLNITNPASALNWIAGSTQNILWTSSGISNVSIDYTLNDGESWFTIIENIPADSSNYEWVVPLTFSTQSRIRIRDTEDPDINSQSPIFTISTLAITSPIGGEFWKIGTSKNITWDSDGISQLRLQYSTNNGSTWNLITSFTPAVNGSYSWTVPNAPSSQARVRINSTANVAQADSSAETFNIYSLSLNSPNSGQIWTGGSEQSIYWSASGVDKLKLEYSLDNGVTWSLIADSVEVMPSNYTWTVPNIPTNQAKVRVSLLENPDIYEESASTFTIRRYAALFPEQVIVDTPSYINVMFHALDQNGIGVSNLKDDEFKIEENNTVISELESFKQVAKADQLSQTMKTVLVLDNSFSLMPDEIIIIKEAAVAFVRNKLPEQLISVYEFSENVNLLQDFTTDTTALINAINGIERGFPSTNLYGAIITGLSRWNDTYSLTHVEQGTLVVFTDGDDTQASATESQVIAARGTKRVITVGLGSDINPTVLQNIGNAGFYQAANANELTEQFLIIQENLIKFTQSFYWLNYVSPKRGDNNHQLRLSLHENQNFTSTASFTIPFNSKGFYSLVFGIAINPEPLNPFGVDTLNVKANIPEIITIQVPFSFTVPEISIQGADAESVTIEKVEDEQNKYLIKATGAPGESKNIKIVEATNNYSKDLVLVLSNQNPPSKIVLSAPADSISIPQTAIQFKWESDPNMSDTYTFQLSSVLTFENIITDSTVVDTLFLQDNLNLNETYYWRVKGHNGLGDGEWSDTWTFSTFESVLAPVNLLLPANNETGVSLTPEFKWSSNTNAQSYRFQLALSSDFASVSMDSTGISDTLFHYSEELQHSTMYYWRVKAVNEDGESNWSDIYSFESLIVTSIISENLPFSYELVQNYPNPFNPSTNIRYGIPNSAYVRLEVYNIIGQRVALLVNEQKNAGWHIVNFDATKLSSGLYFYRIQAENYIEVKKMMLIK
jgi:photosystem II stability/assembly factor-like uncharacterized protein